MAALLFWALTLTCCAFAAAYGGRAGRAIAALYILACAATVGAWFLERDWTRTHVATFAVDALLLVALLRVALASDRWFPIWFTGFHLVAVVSHLASYIAPGFLLEIYFLLQAFWSIPMLLALVIGVALDRQGGVRDEPRAASGARRPA